MSEIAEIQNIFRRMLILEREIEEFRIKLVNETENDNLRALFREFRALEIAYFELSIFAFNL